MLSDFHVDETYKGTYVKDVILFDLPRRHKKQKPHGFSTGLNWLEWRK
jgi:hypothetical protein